MTHNTQIHEQKDLDIGAILNVGRTNDGKIYIDIRVYKTGDVIEVGDITIAQEDWDQINSNLIIDEDEKLFVCPKCGDIVTENDILESLTTGGFGMCLCCFGNGHRTLVRYEPYIKEELTPPITPHEIEIIKAVRALSEE